MKLAIFTATRWEHQSVLNAFTVEEMTTIAGVRCAIGYRGLARIFLFQSGIGPQKAYHVSLAALSNEQWDLVVSSGFAGALVPSAIGALVVGSDVLMEGIDFLDHVMNRAPILCDEFFGKTASQIASSIHGGSQFGHIVCLPWVLGTGSEKKMLAARTQAVAVDMESAALGHVAQTKNIPFLIVRTVTDLVDEDLPVDFNLFLHPSSWMKGVSMIIRKPSSILGFLRLRTHVREASGQLTAFFQKFFDSVGPVGDRLDFSPTG